MSNKKILIATGIYPPDIGGPATVLKYLADDLAAGGFSIKLITYSCAGKNTNDPNYVARVLKNRPGSRLVYFCKMLIFAFRSDIIYAWDVYGVGYFAYLINRIIGKKYIIRFVGDSAWETAIANNWTNESINDFLEKKHSRKIEILKERRKKILLDATLVVTVSNFMASVAKKIGVPEKKIKVIYNAVDFEKKEFNQKAVEKIKSLYGQEAKIIITACRLNVWKGVDGIIRVLPRLEEKIGRFNFLVLGDGPERNNLKYLAEKLNVASFVHFLGNVSQRDIFNYFKAADLFILNTNFEAMSHTLLEAMSAGTPIITTMAGGNPEIITDKEEGVLIDYNNEEELISAIAKILNNQNFSKSLVEKANQKLELFKWRRVVEQTIEILKTI